MSTLVTSKFLIKYHILLQSKIWSLMNVQQEILHLKQLHILYPVVMSRFVLIENGVNYAMIMPVTISMWEVCCATNLDTTQKVCPNNCLPSSLVSLPLYMFHSLVLENYTVLSGIEAVFKVQKSKMQA